MKLLRNIKFGMEQWKFRKGQIIFLALQIIVSFLMLCYMFQNFYNFHQLNQQIEHLMSGQEIFKWRDMNDEAWNLELMEEKNAEKFLKLLNAFEETKAETLVVNNSHCTTVSKKDVDIVEVTDAFFEKYHLQGNFTMEDIRKYFLVNSITLDKEEKLIKPTVAGANFAESYKVGDVLSDDFGLQYQIVGFLEKGSVYSMPTQSKDLIPMDNTLITPVYLDTTDHDDIMEYMFSCQFITDNRQNLSKIEDTNYELGLLDGYFISYSNQLEIVKRDTKEGLLLFGSFGILLFLFSIIGIVGMLIQLLQDYEYEYGVNMLCGADTYDIFIRLVFQITLFILLGVSITFVIFGFGKPFLHILELAAISVCILYVYSWKKLSSNSILSKLRSCQ